MTISGVDQPGEEHLDEHQHESWAVRLRAAESVVQTYLGELGIDTLHRRYGQRAGRAGLAGHVFELRVLAAQRDIDKVADVQAAEGAATAAGKLCGATIRADRMTVSMSIESFARLIRQATPEHQRDAPVTEDPPLGTAQCSECGATVALLLPVREGRRPLTCSPRCRNKSSWRRRIADRMPSA